MIFEQLKRHTKLEELQGMEAHPAMRRAANDSKILAGQQTYNPLFANPEPDD